MLRGETGLPYYQGCPIASKLRETQHCSDVDKLHRDGSVTNGASAIMRTFGRCFLECVVVKIR